MQAKRKQIYYNEILNECGKTINAVVRYYYNPKTNVFSITSGFMSGDKSHVVKCTYSSKIIVNGVLL